MLKGIRLINYKSFKDTGWIDLAPITILCGKNSSGKSTLLQSILLFKQTIESTSSLMGEGELNLDGKYLHYPRLEDVAFGLPKKWNAFIEYGFKLEIKEGVFQDLCIEYRNKVCEDGITRVVINKMTINKSVENETINIKRRKGKYCYNEAFKRIINRKLSITKKKGILEKEYKFDGIVFEKIMPYVCLSEIVDDKENNKKISKDKENAIKNIFLSPIGINSIRNIIEVCGSIRYLGPIRAAPKRTYVYYSNKEVDIDEEGSNVAYVLWANKDKEIEWKNGSTINFMEALKECLSIVGLDQEIYPKNIGNMAYRIDVDLFNIDDKNKRKSTLADVGFGYSQVLPIILRMLLAPKDSIVLLEQPEIHLHPSCAGNLSDLLILFSKIGKRFIVETHSIEMIEKIRLRVVEGKALPDDINIVFTSKDEETGISNIRQLALDLEGSPNEWPKGFCDESSKIIKKIVLERAKRP